MNVELGFIASDVAAGEFNRPAQCVLNRIAEFHDSLLGREIDQSGHCRLQPGDAQRLLTDTEVNTAPLQSIVKRKKADVDVLQSGAQGMGNICIDNKIELKIFVSDPRGKNI